MVVRVQVRIFTVQFPRAKISKPSFKLKRHLGGVSIGNLKEFI